MQTSQNQAVAMPDDIDDAVRILQLVTGKMDGRPFWAYLAMFPTKYQEYATEIEAGNPVDLGEYGDVMAQGWGDAPPADVQEKMAEEYGAEADFEEKLKAMVEETLVAQRAEER